MSKISYKYEHIITIEDWLGKYCNIDWILSDEKILSKSRLDQIINTATDKYKLKQRMLLNHTVFLNK